jgi:purine-binding chemotaxis protein CheW
MKTEPDRINSILRERAEKLAKSNRQETGEIAFEIIEFRIGEERFGLDAKYIVDISNHNVCSIPSAPPHIAGVANIRGRTVDVVKLTVFLGIESASSDSSLMMMISGDKLEFAFPIDEVFGIRHVATAEVQDTPNAASSLDCRNWLQAATTDGVQIMDGEKVLSDFTLVVDEDV